VSSCVVCCTSGKYLYQEVTKALQQMHRNVVVDCQYSAWNVAGAFDDEGVLTTTILHHGRCDRHPMGVDDSPMPS